MVTPNRPLAICLIALVRFSPLRPGTYRAGSSPPSPQLLMPPSRFIATAIASCASGLSEPSDIAPETKRRTIDSTGSTSSSGTGVAGANSKRPRNVQRCSAWELINAAYSRYFSGLFS